MNDVKAKTMKAVLLEKPSTAQDLTVSEVPLPEVRPGWVLIKVKAFGVNRSELFTRRGQSPSVKLPRIMGIECVGKVVDPSDSALKPGQKVISMMGGLGRDFDGSYAEYTLIPADQVYPIDIDLPWPELAAIPEVYYTAWCSLVEVLKLKSDEYLLIRGGSSSVGLASAQIAKHLGAQVIATTRNKDKIALVEEYGADKILIDDESLEKQLHDFLPQGADKILELVGTKTLSSSFALLRQGGTLCMTGILSGQWELEHFSPMDFIPSGSYFTTYDSEHVSTESLYDLFDFLKRNNIGAPIAKVFSLEDIAQAHELMESNMAKGKIVVVNDDKLW